MTTTYSRVEEILVDVLMLEDRSIVRPGAHVVRDLGAESINIAELVIALENEFGIEVATDTVQQASTVEALVGLVDEALAAKALAEPTAG